jgi:hypothetical protein
MHLLIYGLEWRNSEAVKILILEAVLCLVHQVSLSRLAVAERDLQPFRDTSHLLRQVIAAGVRLWDWDHLVFGTGDPSVL